MSDKFRLKDRMHQAVLHSFGGMAVYDVKHVWAYNNHRIERGRANGTLVERNTGDNLWREVMV